MLNRFITFALSFFLLTQVAPTQVHPLQHAQLRAAMDRGDYAGVEQMLRLLMASSPDAFARNNYDYLLARLLEWRGAFQESITLFQRVITRNSPLASYAQWHLAEVARASANPNEEQKLLQNFISQDPNHLMRERAVQRLSESYFRSGQYQAAINTLRTTAGPRRDAMAMVGEAQLALRQFDTARASFDAVLASGSMDDASLRSVRGLDRSGEQNLSMLTEVERLRRARIYQFNRHFAEARRHWLAFVKDFPRSEKRAEALFQLGRGFFLENSFTEAIKWFNQVHDEFPQSDEGEQGFYFAGHCYQYSNNTDQAISRYEEFLKAYPESEYFGYAHLNAIDTLRSAGRLQEALKWVARGQALVKEPFIVTAALFKKAKIRLTQENYQAALEDFSALKAKNLNLRGMTASTNLAEVTFMRGYCLQKLGRYEEAINEYLTLGEVRSGAAGYYGRRAGEQLQKLANDPRAKNLIASRRNQFLTNARAAHAQGNMAAAKTAANQVLRFENDEATNDEMYKILRSAYSKLRGYQMQNLTLTPVGRTAPLDAEAAPASETGHQTLAAELLFLGLFDEGASELALTQAPRNTILYYCAKGNCANRTVDFSEPILNALPEDYRLELLPKDWAEMFYPYPFRSALARFATPRNIDPRFALSIVRQESRYDPKVKSLQAARGMMQFISLTAEQIAAQLNINDFEQSDLYDPDIAVLFGSQYMKNLFSEFGSPEAVAAAYNGSEDSVRRWKERSKSPEADRLVIEILKRETKDYVFKVMNYYSAYQKIYPNGQATEKQ